MMLVLVVLGAMAMALILALMLTRRDVAHRRLLAVATVPLFLTVLVPLPFSLTFPGPTASVRAKLLGVSRVGIFLSFMLSTVGVLLLLRALSRRDRQDVALLGVETALAAIPALIFVVSWAVFR